MSRCAEPKEADPISGFDACDPNAAKTDDSCAQQRSGLDVVKSFRKRKDEIGASGSVLGIPAIHVVTRERGRIAEIFHSLPAVGTRAIDAAQPGHANASSVPEFASTAVDNLTN